MTQHRGAALVTGAAQRIGLVIADRLASAGYDVALHARAHSKEKAEQEAKRLTRYGVKTCVITGDLMQASFCEEAIDAAVARLGHLRLLVNNAAVFESDQPDDMDLERWERHFSVNLRAAVILSQRFAAQSLSGAGGAIVNVIDQRVLRPTPQFFSYTLSKSALWTATRTMAQAFADRGVRVNAVGPGPVLPNTKDGDQGFFKEVEGVPLHRAVDPTDIAAAVLYLAGANAVTGQMIAVDAGQHLGWRTPDIVE